MSRIIARDGSDYLVDTEQGILRMPVEQVRAAGVDTSVVDQQSAAAQSATVYDSQNDPWRRTLVDQQSPEAQAQTVYSSQDDPWRQRGPQFSMASGMREGAALREAVSPRPTRSSELDSLVDRVMSEEDARRQRERPPRPSPPPGRLNMTPEETAWVNQARTPEEQSQRLDQLRGMGDGRTAYDRAQLGIVRAPGVLAGAIEGSNTSPEAQRIVEMSRAYRPQASGLGPAQRAQLASQPALPGGNIMRMNAGDAYVMLRSPVDRMRARREDLIQQDLARLSTPIDFGGGDRGPTREQDLALLGDRPRGGQRPLSVGSEEAMEFALGRPHGAAEEASEAPGRTRPRRTGGAPPSGLLASQGPRLEFGEPEMLPVDKFASPPRQTEETHATPAHRQELARTLRRIGELGGSENDPRVGNAMDVAENPRMTAGTYSAAMSDAVRALAELKARERSRASSAARREAAQQPPSFETAGRHHWPYGVTPDAAPAAPSDGGKGRGR